MGSEKLHGICQYLRNLLEYRRNDRRALSIICSWLWEHGEGVGLEVRDDDLFNRLSAYPAAVEKREVTRELFLVTRDNVLSLLHIGIGHEGNDEAINTERIRILADTLRLDQKDMEIFTIFYRYETNDAFESLVDELYKNFSHSADLVAALSGLDRQEVAERLSYQGGLLEKGLLKSASNNGRYLSSCYKIPRSVRVGLQNVHLNHGKLKSLLVGKCQTGNLAWDDYEHLGKTRDYLSVFVERGVRNNEAGVNILLWGAPGTGKTEFCKTLAAHLGFELYSVGEKDEDGFEPTRDERLQALQLAQNLMRGQDQVLLLFDEIDDLLMPGKPGSLLEPQVISKVFMNRLFEENPVPTIWTLNNIDLLDESILRRMSVVVEFEKPPGKSSTKILSRLLDRHGVDLRQDSFTMAVSTDVTPAVLHNAVRFAKISEMGHEALTFALDGLSRAMGTDRSKEWRGKGSFNAALVNADMDLDDLAEKLAEKRIRAFSLCLYGPPGTGKSEYARWLAWKLEMEPQVVRGSDLLGPFVGETEKAIADVFRKAQRRGSFLILDEVDSLLSSRREARQSWEVSQVNEMLTWMERHPFPFVCTTNLKEALDSAAMRRFTFKCRFDYLKPGQVELAFRHFFGMPLGSEWGGKLTCLTPGDFAVVRKKEELLGRCGDIDKYIKWLSSEVENKNETVGSRVGFKLC
ncbi:AAA family ATPase [Geothermobacter hydrogeniphilus]|uniref:AAA+ ATPase domain-containing protein n=1 Tax=Geothermobacter hydrogeniphilus TaxID=1969733 RepID=A0A1X0Y8B0_9BACT|nr:AAA family ATPase [Geothermobacter hydrogeniphilus]ORJ61352.1 hypothetical protein B5V00_06885 [Geothermobacter hydrogeniphilus]